MGWGKVQIPPQPTNPAPQALPPATEANALPYAGVLAQRGVTIDRWPGGARVIVPPPRGWQVMIRWEWAVIAILALRFFIALSDGELAYKTGLLAVVLFAWILLTLSRERAFVLNEQELRIGFVFGRRYLWTERWPRGAVGEIRMNSVNGNLLVRITGKDLREFMLGRNREITREVAAALQQALIECVPPGEDHEPK